MRKIIILGYEVMVDDEDFEIVASKKWHHSSRASKKGESGPYFVNHTRIDEYQYLRVMLHRLIMKAKSGDIVDHINRNTLDNRKSNLRITTAYGNVRNRSIINRFGKIRGITERSRKNGVVYEVLIRAGGAQIHIGKIRNPMIAEYELMKLCNKYHGEHSRYAKYKNQSF